MKTNPNANWNMSVLMKSSVIPATSLFNWIVKTLYNNGLGKFFHTGNKANSKQTDVFVYSLLCRYSC